VTSVGIASVVGVCLTTGIRPAGKVS